MARALAACVLLWAGAARAESDGYCDFVEGTAAAQSVLGYAPEVFANVGYIEQSSSALPPPTNVGPRIIGGVRYRLTGIYQAQVTRERASADCRRHEALSQIHGATTYRALEARSRVLDAALHETDKMIAQATEDLKAQRTTAVEANATRLRAEELRQLATDARRQLAALPPPTDGMVGALAAYQHADHDVERAEGKLRRVQAFEVVVRAGFDQYLDRNTPTPYFAVLGVSVNLGAVFQGGSNERAAAGREKFVRLGHDVSGDANVARLQVLVDVETRRETETATLAADLQHQLDQLVKLGGQDARRYHQVVWFDWVKASAEHAYLATHLESLHQVLGPR